MKIGVLILYTENWMPLAKEVLPNAQEYCDRHGYTLITKCYEEEYTSDFGFRKIMATMSLLPHLDAMWNLDLDTKITNHNIKVEDFISKGSDFFITEDVNGVNAGSFIVVKSSWSDGFLVWLMERRGELGIHCENDAIVSYIKEYPNSPVKILPHPSINSYLYDEYGSHYGRIQYDANRVYPKPTRADGQWGEGDFVLHLPGIGMNRRLEILKNIKVVK